MKRWLGIFLFGAALAQSASAIVQARDPELYVCLAFEAGTSVLSQDAHAAISNAIPILRRGSPDLRNLSLSIRAWAPEREGIPSNGQGERPSTTVMKLSLERLSSLQTELSSDLPEIAPKHLDISISGLRRYAEPAANCDAVIVAYFGPSRRVCGEGGFCAIGCNATGCTTR